jgi:DNA-binding NarL/FixJ family response regulator
VITKNAHDRVFHAELNTGRWGMGEELSVTGILVVDRHALFRHGLIGLLREEKPDWRCAGTASVADLLDSIHAANVVLLDLGLPDLDGVDGLRRLRKSFPHHCFIILSDRDDRRTILDCLSAGAHGYLLKSASPAQYLRALETILDGGIYAPGSLSNAPGQPVRLETPPAPALANLTGRQRDVFQLLTEGCDTKTIARRLDLGVGTVKVHLAAIYRSFGARTRLEALAKAHRTYHA